MATSSILNHFISKAARNCKHKMRSKMRAKYFDALESRVLFTTYTWDTLHATDTNWDNPDNWGVGGVNAYPHLEDDEAVFSDTGTLTVMLPNNRTIGNLTIQGDSQIMLKPGGAPAADRTLTVQKDAFTPPDPDPKLYGHIVLDQTTGKTASLTIAGDAAGHKLTVTARDFVSTSSATQHGDSALVVEEKQTIEFSENITADGFKFNITNHGAINAKNVELKGKGVNNDDVSTHTIDGTMTITEQLIIGGTGRVSFEIDNGKVTCDHFQLVNYSALSIHSDNTKASWIAGKGTLTFATQSWIGNCTGFTQAGGLADHPAILEIYNLGLLEGKSTTGAAHLGIAGGNGARLDVIDGGWLALNGDLYIFAGDIDGPTVWVRGISSAWATAKSSIQANNIVIRNQSDHKSGVLIVSDNAQVNVWNELSLWAQSIQSRSLVYVDSKALLSAVTIKMNDGVAGGWSTMWVGDAIVGVGDLTSGGMELGGNGCLATLWTEPSARVNCIGTATVLKDVKAYIVGTGVVTSITTTPAAAPLGTRPPLADIMPGDYYIGADDEGTLIKNESSSYPFGSLRIEGDLLSNDENANLGLDIVLGSGSNENSSISVKGDVFINGRLFVEAFDDETELEAGNFYTIIKSDGTITGQFANMPEGLIVNSDALDNLPELDAGLGWYIGYTSTEVILSIRPIATHITTDAHRLDIAPNSDIEVTGQVLIGSGYGYGNGYGYNGSGSWDLGDNPTLLPEQSSSLAWESGQMRTFNIYVSAAGEVTFELQGQTPKVYTYSNDLTDIFLRVFDNTGGVAITADALVLNGTLAIGDQAFEDNAGVDILWIAGLGSQFTSLSGHLTIDFSTAGSFSGKNLSMQIMLGSAVEQTPLTVDSSINTAGEVTLNWSAPSGSATGVEIKRSDDGGANYTTVYSSSSLGTTTFTDDATGGHPNSIYVVTEVDFSWHEVSTTHIPTAGPTLTINLNSSGDLEGVAFVMDETDPTLMDILVDGSQTAQIQWGRIGELIINGTSSNDDLSVSGDLFAALTFHNDDGQDSLTLSGGTWAIGDGWGSPIEYDGDNNLNVTVTDGAWLTIGDGQYFHNLTIDQDSAVISESDTPGHVYVTDDLQVNEGGLIADSGLGWVLYGNASNAGTILIEGGGYLANYCSNPIDNDGDIYITGEYSLLQLSSGGEVTLDNVECDSYRFADYARTSLRLAA